MARTEAPTGCRCTVGLDVVMQELGQGGLRVDPTAWATGRGVELVTDWRGLPALAVDDAARLVAEHQGRAVATQLATLGANARIGRLGEALRARQSLVREGAYQAAIRSGRSAGEAIVLASEAVDAMDQQPTRVARVRSVFRGVA